MKKIISVILLLTIYMGIISAQDESGNVYGNVIPPSPTSFEFTKYGQIPVGKFSGTPNITIPIYTLKGRDLTHPVYLSYNSNGIKVDQVSSWVGMGWSLVAGGVISRVIRDEPDDIGLRYPTDDMSELDYIEWGDFLTKSCYQDTEPDLFSYSFNGYSGKFVLDANDHPRLIPYENMIISMIDDGQGNDSIMITTPDGIKYYFGTDDNSREITKTRPCNSGGFSTGYVTSWYLTKIQHPSGEEINFTYTSGSIFCYVGLSQTITEVDAYQMMNCPTCASMIDEKLCFDEIWALPKYLEIITTDNMKIEFETDTIRPDINSSSFSRVNLKTITIKERETNEVYKEFALVKAFSNNTNYSEPHHGWLSTDALETRMFLDNIVESSNGVSLPPYTFDYYNINALPPRLSFAQDHWGYFNAKNNNDFVQIPYEYDSIFWNHDGADREPNGNAKYGLIEQINYPTGGKTLFEYESNTYWNGTTNVVSGGMRIKRITSSTSDSDPHPTIKRYYYAYADDLTRSSAITPEDPLYVRNTFAEFDCGSGYGIQTIEAPTLYSNTLSLLYNVNGNHIAYKSVIESSGENFENGGEYFIYLAHRDEPAIRVLFGGSWNYNQRILGATYSNQSWNAGMLKEHGFLKKALGGSFITLKKTTNDYNYENYAGDERNSTEIVAAVTRKLFDPYFGQLDYYHICTSNEVGDSTQIGWECIADHPLFDDRHHWWTLPFFDGWRCMRPNAENVPIYSKHPCCYLAVDDTIIYSYSIDNYDVMTYSIYSRWGYLKETTTTEYDENGQNGVSDTVHYEYEDYGMLRKKTISNSKGDNIIVENYYPQDYDPDPIDPIIDSLFQNGLIGKSIDTRRSNNGNLVSGNLTKYNDKGQPTEIWKEEDNLGIPSTAIDTTNPYSYGAKKSTIDYVNNILSEIQPEDDIPTSYIWGYNNTFPIAQVTNASNEEILHTSYEDDPYVHTWNGNYAFDDTRSRTGGYSMKTWDSDPDDDFYYTGFTYPIITENTKFRYSVWAYSTGPSSEVFLFWDDSTIEDYHYTGVVSTTSTKTNQWVLIEGEATVPNGVKKMFMRVDNNGQGDIWFDDLRFYPADGQMTTYTYDPLIGMTSQTDTNGQSSYYEYDDLGRLKAIKDHEGNLIKQVQYNYANQ